LGIFVESTLPVFVPIATIARHYLFPYSIAFTAVRTTTLTVVQAYNKDSRVKKLLAYPVSMATLATAVELKHPLEMEGRERKGTENDRYAERSCPILLVPRGTYLQEAKLTS
jgi:hypothetical protein